jgi:hypothetical protein
VTVFSTKGSIRIDGPVAAASGRSGTGGELDASAAGDVIVGADVDVSGGEFDGGVVFIEAGRDARLTSVHASATRLDGSGGDVTVTAGRDLRVVAGAVIETDGGRAGGFGGDGGSQLYVADGSVIVEASAALRAQGARPDGAGGSIEIEASGAATIRGALLPGALGAEGDGGFASLDGCSVTLAAGAAIDNPGADGENLITGHGQIVLENGSSMLADAATGLNAIVYGDSAAPPTVLGDVVPPAARTFDPQLGVCASPPTTSTTIATTTTFAGLTTTTVSIPQRCGDGVVSGTEECDTDGIEWTVGVACRADCTLVACGDPNDSGTVTAADALLILRAAVGTAPCAGCVCDVDDTGGVVRAGDALRVLRVAVGLPLELRCPRCV